MTIDHGRLFAMLHARLDVRRADDADARWLTEKLVFHDCTRDPLMQGDRAACSPCWARGGMRVEQRMHMRAGSLKSWCSMTER